MRGREEEKVATVYFLVHPGYDAGLAPPNPRSEKLLLERYRSTIDSLGQYDVLVILSPAKKDDHMRQLRGESDGKPHKHPSASEDSFPWVDIERYSREKLGRRCVVMGDPDFITGPRNRPSESVRELKSILHARGLSIDEGTPAAYLGTSVGTCIKNTLWSVFSEMGLRGEHTIMAGATNYNRLEEPELAEVEKDLRGRYIRHHGTTPNVKVRR